MNGGYSMVEVTNLTAAKLEALYAQGKPIVVHRGNIADIGTITKSGNTYTVTTPTKIYTATPDSTTVMDTETPVYNYITDTGVKNLFLPTVEDISPASSGDFGLTVNSDKTITTIGKKTSAQFITLGTFTPDKTGEYYLSCGIDTNIDTHAIYIKIGSVYYWARKDGIRIPLEAGTEYTVTLKIAANYENNETYKPMIRISAIEDPTYAPYSPSNSALYALINSLDARVTALEEA